MQPDFRYSVDDDTSVYKQGKIYTAGRSVIVLACTLQGSQDGITKKPNEDAFSISIEGGTIHAAVFDGCTSQAPIDWLKDQTGARFASHFLKHHYESQVMGRTQPVQILTKLNNLLREESMSQQRAPFLDIHTLPATTATIIALDVETRSLKLSHVGDSFCILYYSNGASQLITIDRNEAYDKVILDKIYRLAKAKHVTPRQARQDPSIAVAIRDIRQSTHNRSDGTGQGILNGDPQAEQYFQNQSFDLTEVDSILLGSDGLIPPGYTEHSDKGRAQLLEIVREGGLDALIAKKHEVENSDPDWKRVRYKHSDDSTGIYLKLG